MISARGTNFFKQLASIASLGLQHIKARHEAEQRAHEAEAGRQKLDELTRELERSNNDLERFASTVAHDLQEPLRTVTGFVQLLARRYGEALDTKAQKFIDHAVNGTAHMQRLLNDLLQFSRVGGGHQSQTVDLQAILDRCLRNLAGAVHQNNAVVEYDALPQVAANELQMIQLFQT